MVYECQGRSCWVLQSAPLFGPRFPGKYAPSMHVFKLCTSSTQRIIQLSSLKYGPSHSSRIMTAAEMVRELGKENLSDGM